MNNKLENDNVSKLDYKNQCLCGSDEFFKQSFMVCGDSYKTFRICRKCGTVKMLYAYYNDEEQCYKATVQHIPKNK